MLKLTNEMGQQFAEIPRVRNQLVCVRTQKFLNE